MIKNIVLVFGIFALFFIILSNSASGIEWEYDCNSTTGELFKNATIFINGTAYEFNQTINCTYGCANNETCNTPLNVQPEYYMVVIVVVLVSALVFAYLGTKFQGGEFVFGVMQYFFIMISLALVVLAFGILTATVNLGQLELTTLITSGYTMVLYVMIIVIFVFILKLIYDAFIKPIKGVGA